MNIIIQFIIIFIDAITSNIICIIIKTLATTTTTTHHCESYVNFATITLIINIALVVIMLEAAVTITSDFFIF